MLHARGQSTAVLQQQHVDRLHRHTIHTTSAGMAHTNGPCSSVPLTTISPFLYLPFDFFTATTQVFVQTAIIPYYLSTDIDFVCVLCTSSSTAAVASLSLPLSLPVFVQGYLTQQCRHFFTCPFIFSQLQRSACKRHLFSTSLLARIIFRFVTTGLILCTPLYETN